MSSSDTFARMKGEGEHQGIQGIRRSQEVRSEPEYFSKSVILAVSNVTQVATSKVK